MWENRVTNMVRVSPPVEAFNGRAMVKVLERLRAQALTESGQRAPAAETRRPRWLPIH